ncbi:3-hydroxyacyl-CoA dehydrogenase NAD-binding domain-containing protein [Consotaella salsifontis]|uniref:Short chain enoyl-CoA hydratase /3-hydroxyacyl-CoA dehydrogenase n=1 Tax=Consotaella salsifontis TaxID=1365950 RepID=A0A1T4PM89_9HYPH|nr:3-hydroxyacyl-CoA dehydrogenase NAD-binding domain-containing protein [Consotaella salsifontis]SJZ92337.1 short chain enoyl-CoA hydratase /3-hydroxyacyl-CoA dehydrogenase [Consotaella salsifontis]
MAVTLEKDGSIAVVTVDSPPVNALSRDLRQELIDAAEAADADPDIEAVVLMGAGRAFIAGADVSEFDRLPEPPHLPDVVARIETAKKPWIAAIHGAALGGGMEVALGCRFRIAAPGTRLGFPEVALGVVPGAGGTVRTPRLVGFDKAVALVTGGKPVGEEEAKAIGLIDAIAEGDLRQAALSFARAALGKPMPSPLAARDVAAPHEGFWVEAETRLAKRGEGAARLRALACLKRAAEADFAAAMAHERATFLELRASDEAAALRHVFFAERAASRPPELKGIEPRPIRSAGVVGGGTMGAGIALALRRTGLPVVLLERDEAAAARGLDNFRDLVGGMVKRALVSEPEADELLAGLSVTTEIRALGDADLVIEAVFEEIGVKRDVFARLDGVCRPDAILATNTSYLDPRRIVAGLGDPERYVGLHFFSPAHVMKLLEIVPLPETAPEVLATAFALAARLGKVPVKAGICEGFIGNRILKRYRAAAEDLLRQGAAIADIDAAMRGFGFRMGPFEAQDMGGLDIAYLQREGARAAGEPVLETLADILVRVGRKGRKTGAGWYDYAESAAAPTPSSEVGELLAAHVGGGPSLSGEAIAARLVSEMAEEGAAILAEGIAVAAKDIDLVEIHGYGFPRWRGGPMFHASRRGAKRFADDLGRPPSPALAAFLSAG